MEALPSFAETLQSFLILCCCTSIYLILHCHATYSSHDLFAGWSIVITLGHKSKDYAILHQHYPWYRSIESSSTKCISRPYPVQALSSTRTHCRPSIPLRLGQLPSECYTTVSTLTCRHTLPSKSIVCKADLDCIHNVSPVVCRKSS